MPYLAVLLHPLERLDGWTSWSVHPSTVIGIAALAALYGWRARSVSVTPGQKLSFAAGLLVLFVSLNGPIHDLSDSYLFSVHMVQHLLLTMLVVPLLIAGTPGAMLRPALRSRPVAAVARAITHPGTCFIVFNATMAIWHIPEVYDLAMRHHGVHIAQHLCFLVASTLMWWPIMSPLPELPRLSYPKQMLYTFLLTLPMSLIGMLITYADQVLYPAYQSAPRLWGISPMEDQLIGGLLMWIPGGLIFLGVLSVIFFRWSARQSDDTASAQVDWRAA
ncbi:MAG TPA: cytochrome c oxidase assembly protein [Gemmatimonadaceae bacterium]|nr:cytochrome c oxidase assembly protein [Gemmatimonadaceae bacterium]